MHPLLLLSFCLIVLGVAGVVLLSADPNQGLRTRRIAAVVTRVGRTQGAFDTALLAKKPLPVRADRDLPRGSWPARMRLTLARAGLGRLPLPLYLLASLALGRLLAEGVTDVALAVVGLPAQLRDLGLVLVTLAGAGALHFGLVAYLGRWRAARRAALALAALPEALEIVARAVRAGRNPTEAIAATIPELAGPLREEFAEIQARVRLGMSLEAALAQAGRRLGLPDLDMVATAVSIAASTGGSLAEALNNLAMTLRERRQFAVELKAITAQGRASARMVSALPPVMLVLTTLISPEHTAPLFEQKAGHVILGLAAILIVVGSLVTRRMAQIKF